MWQINVIVESRTIKDRDVKRYLMIAGDFVVNILIASFLILAVR